MKLTITTQSGRLDKVLSTMLPDVTRSQAQKWLERNLVTVNETVAVAKYKVQPGDMIVVTPPVPTPLAAVPEAMPLAIVYEDDAVIVVNKPQGMVVHPAPGHPDHTLVNGLLAHTTFSGINDVLRPGIVHRIDKDTSGLLMVAKTAQAQVSLAAQLKAKTNLREYLAIVHGTFNETAGTIDAPLGRSPKDRKKQAVVADGRRAVTHFQVLATYNHYSLVKCVLDTGRTHQIRVHMAYIHHPVAGDPLYAPARTLPGAGQYLHAATLGFTHPVSEAALAFTVAPPANFAQMLIDLQQGIDKTRVVR
ncbi:RluA family pseudouridine synthase [Lacticaseibacillus nasuensis]|uniref:Pseudouridine synthase n=1 Tax=Lacticaseibacillus nasuensis JCM 17158 TaxID=1291734 RepID=A0A0R1JZU9_9LACO|nr:RluA family pseudouridine synthase [Lacticaseibacillus nasuensis]KRK73346.1 pseudouridylate synthase [Lacticaseibacillus nasuensis JCM 17158]